MKNERLEKIMERNENLVADYRETYGLHIEMLESSTLAKVRPIDDFDRVALGKQLEQFDIMKMMYENAGNVNQLGLLTKIA